MQPRAAIAIIASTGPAGTDILARPMAPRPPKPSAASRDAIPRRRSRVRRILASTDFSDESLAGVRYAVRLAERLGAAVDLLHVVESRPRMAGMEAIEWTGGESDVTRLARVQLRKLATRMGRNELNITSLVRLGIPFHEITSAARERGADLVVIATHGYTGARRVLLGSTAERVVRHATCAVLTVRAGGTERRTGKRLLPRLKKIIVPIDFSSISQRAFPFATLFAERFGAEIILLHVVEKLPVNVLLGGALMNETVTPLMKQASTDLEAMVRRLNRSSIVSISAAVRDGTPFREICDLAKVANAGMIVLTTHGYTGLKHVWLGSTAERVVRHAPCPVLAVREAPAGEDTEARPLGRGESP
jgi:nucleotide-binding universal stress UspA family protein